jgi:hypothetical protein
VACCRINSDRAALTPRTACPCSNYCESASDEFVSASTTVIPGRAGEPRIPLRLASNGSQRTELFIPYLCRQRPNFLSRFNKSARRANHSKVCPAYLAKILLFTSDPNHIYISSCPALTRGRIAIVTDVEAGCDGRGLRQKTNDVARGRRSRVVLTPRRWRQVSDDASHHAGDGGKKARSPGRARSKLLKPLCGECRVIPV